MFWCCFGASEGAKGLPEWGLLSNWTDGGRWIWLEGGSGGTALGLARTGPLFWGKRLLLLLFIIKLFPPLPPDIGILGCGWLIGDLLFGGGGALLAWLELMGCCDGLLLLLLFS